MEVKISNNTVIKFYPTSERLQNISLGKDCLYEAICAWKTVIHQLVQMRLNACKDNLVSNLSRVDSVDEYVIVYHTENGNMKHYSAPAAQAMEMILDNILENPEKIVNNHMCLLQISKALYWCNSYDRSGIEDGYSFDNLYSLILDRLILK